MRLTFIGYRRENEFGVGLGASLLKNRKHRRSNRANALAGFRGSEPERTAGDENFRFPKALNFVQPAAGQRDRSRCQNALPRLAVGLCGGKTLAEGAIA